MESIAVIGAGFAGLSAASKLQRAGLDVTVFEARDRVGGRVWSQKIPTRAGNRVIERGAEFVLQNYYVMQDLARELGLELVETGMSYYVREPGDVPGVTAADTVTAAKEAYRILDGMDATATAEDVLARIDADENLVDALRSRIEISSAVSASEVTADALRQVASMEPQKTFRIGGGNQGIALRLAEQLGDAIRLKTPVRRVVALPGGGVVITTAAGESLHFTAVIVAVPIAVLRDQSVIETPTTPERERALQGVIQGHAVKLHAALAEVPPPSAIMSVKGRYWTWTARDVEGVVAPVLNSFMGSLEAIERSGVVEAPQNWIDSVRRLRPDLAITGDPFATVWANDPYAQGAYTAHTPAFSEEDTQHLEAPIGDVYFAGEYAEPVYTGLMEGALRSGQRAGDRVLAKVDSLVEAVAG